VIRANEVCWRHHSMPVACWCWNSMYR
jgi:hypothetical protein